MRTPGKMPQVRLPAIRYGVSRGFSLVSAIFLLVVLAGLGTAILNVATVQHKSSAFDVQGARAYQAARAGIEWGLFHALETTTYCNGSTAEATSFALPAATTLAGFTVTVRCTPTVFDETTTIAVSQAITTREISATACNNPGATGCPNASPGENYVQRVINARL